MIKNAVGFQSLAKREILRFFVVFTQTIVPPLISSSLFIARWHNHIQEVLLSPLSYMEMVLGLMIGGVARGILTATGVYGISLFFTRFVFHDYFVVVYFFIVVTIIFSSLGLIVGLWAQGFEKLSVWNTFVLTPLIYFGGVFHSVEMVPAPLQFVTKLNPIFYLVNGLRYGMLGVSDVSVPFGMGLAAGLAIVLFLIVERLFRRGYHLRS